MIPEKHPAIHRLVKAPGRTRKDTGGRMALGLGKKIRFRIRVWADVIKVALGSQGASQLVWI
ncbi:MAG: hypothetical protein WHX93_08320 [bacterium]